MEHAIPAWATLLQGSALGEVMRGSLFLYPAANLLHVLALGFLLGPIVLLDLRVLGLGQTVPLGPAARILSRVAGASLVLLLASGAMLFAADAVGLAANPLMQAKLLLIALGLANAALFRLERPRLLQRLQAVLSLAIWLLVAICGRLAAYI
ncbi:MAG: hypothetical protein H7Y60_11610 [Rhodospirillaceae bacterium]|nr:hypothetical protein [Rhodospirillales bacterium]